MSIGYELPLDAGGRRFRRILAPALAASVAIHLGLALLAAGTRVTVDGERDGALPERSQRGEDVIRTVELRAVDRRTVPRPPTPVAVAEPDLSGRPTVSSPRLPHVQLASQGAPAPRMLGRAAGDADEGAPAGRAGARTSPAVPRSLFPAWDPPASVRGRTVTVRVQVDAQGRPTGAVELDPPTPDEGFNDVLRERVRRMVFRPARRNGEPVASWAELTFEF